MIIAYVADRTRLHHLLISIASWRRFEPCLASVIDIGLCDDGRRCVEAVADGDVTFQEPCDSAPFHKHISAVRRPYAFEQKTMVGSIVQGDPIVFLDSDVLVVNPSFLQKLSEVRDKQLIAVPSAWDSDYLWTYTAASLSSLRSVTKQENFHLQDPICNSGVWAMRSKSAAAVAPVWHSMLHKALDSRELQETVRRGTQIGDQEFLVPAARCCNTGWTHLHGSFNMQVHENRMRWSIEESGNVLGGHLLEPLEPVRAIHYGCDADGTVALEADMIASPDIRAWIRNEYRTCWEIVRTKLDPRSLAVSVADLYVDEGFMKG
jgi:hypothetical protein